MTEHQLATHEQWQAARRGLTALHPAPPLRVRIQVGLVALLLVLASGAWALTDDRMSGMDAGPGTELGGLGWFIVVWVTMMAAMMLPSIAPMVLAHARFQQAGRGRRRAPAIGVNAVFVAGYLLSWAAAGLVGYAIFDGVRSLGLGFLGWEDAGRYLAGGVILVAALYQLTAAKDACLRHCRSPVMLLERWRPGRLGALRMGVEHGTACIGCCWALMAALFALGVMSIAWMAFVAALIAAERLLPWKAPAVRTVAVVLAVLGLAVAFAPERVPGLAIPGSPTAMPAMMGDASGSS
jgi:predicted metal-binding membrane protein